ncbi:response regulator [Geomonas azotofigens]|uniref:response regulator n=1 Tax=Geomonas azotofigens TaxID=2843196 RepID=UPI001C11BB17|nr:response regulator [Geomonas azotofigens]MBU5611676.1 response regulator [Geomonas azotofigens]
MKILVVEDDENKLDQISEILRLIPNLSLTSKRSYQSGLREILDSRYDLIVLDMSMPTYDKSSSEPGGRFRKFAGKEILAEIRREKVDARVLLVTGFDTFGEGATFITLQEMDKKLSVLFPSVYLGSIFYNASETNWADELKAYVLTIQETLHA